MPAEIKKKPEWKANIEHMMNEMDPQLRDVALAIGEVFMTFNLDVAKKFIHPNFIDHEASPGVGVGPEGYINTARYMHQAFSNASWIPEQIFGFKDRYLMQIHFTGIHTGEFCGIAATGRPVDIKHLHVFRVENGQAIEHWGVRDELTMLRQIGEIDLLYPTPADAGAAMFS